MRTENLALVATAMLSIVAVPAARQSRSVETTPSIAELWQAPTDLATRDLFVGQWGAAYAPDSNATFTFLRPKTTGTNPGMVVTDPQGREWHVKKGSEARPEVIVSRILSAVGYHQPPVYYLPSFSVVSDRRTTMESGRLRLTVKQLKHNGDWDWKQNPFVGTTPHQGLLVMLVLLNSADLKNVNNAFYDVQSGGGHLKEIGDVSRWFVVRDLGTSLGQTGRFNPSQDNLKAFERVGFITGVHGGRVQFDDYHAVHNSVLDGITPDDVRWACALLARLSDHQWSEAFRAGGYSGPRVTSFLNRIHEKIEQGLQVASR